MKTKRVCVLTGGHWSAAKGGLPYQALCLSEFLAEREDTDVWYLARDIDPEYRPNGYNLRSIASPKFLHRLGFFVDAPRLFWALRALSPDVVYQRGLQAYTGIAAAYCQRYGARLVFHVASDYDLIPLKEQKVDFHPGIPWIERRIGEFGIRNAHKIIVQTREQGALLEKHFGRAATATLPNFHPVPRERVEKRRDCLEVVWIGNFKPLKRPELFVDLAESLQDRSIRFTMIGSTGTEDLYSDLLSRARRIPTLSMLGPQPREAVAQVLNRAHVLVNTSEFEGFSNTFIEAWMREVPVLTLGLNPDGVFDDEQIGACANSFDELRSRLLSLARDPDTLAKMAKVSRENACERYSMSNAGRLAEELLAELR